MTGLLSVLVAAAALWARAADLALLEAQQAGGGAGIAPPRLRYLANEGVILEGAGGRLLIDAFFRDGLPEYPAVPAALRDSLERALEGFAGPALVLTTHGHRDHFDPEAVARYLDHNAQAIAVGPTETGARVDALIPVARDRTRDVTPTAREPATLDQGWVRVQALAIPHAPGPPTIQHAAYLLALDGATVLHLGDSNSDPRGWPGLGLPAEGVDIALVPYWYALDDERFRSLVQVTRAGRVVLLHLPHAVGESEEMRARGGWKAFTRRLRQRYPQVEIPGPATSALAPPQWPAPVPACPGASPGPSARSTPTAPLVASAKA